MVLLQISPSLFYWQILRSMPIFHHNKEWHSKKLVWALTWTCMWTFPSVSEKTSCGSKNRGNIYLATSPFSSTCISPHIPLKLFWCWGITLQQKWSWGHRLRQWAHLTPPITTVMQLEDRICFRTALIKLKLRNLTRILRYFFLPAAHVALGDAICTTLLELL